jgi:hypothetical protein
MEVSLAPCIISGFPLGVNDICALLGCYAVQIGSLPQTFQDNLSEDPKEFPEQSVTTYQYKR